MEWFIACGTWIAEKIADYTVPLVGSHLGYIFHYRRNVRDLETVTKVVNDKKKTLVDLADEAERRGETIHVDKCLAKVDEITQAAQNLINTNIECSLRGWFSYLVARYRQSKRAEEVKESLVKIKDEITRFENISFRPKLKNIIENKDYLNSATRDKFVDGIRKVLEDSNIRTIGIHGMSGAGKTTLAKEIARRALNDWNLFDDAVIVTVSQTPILETIQQQIAERLNLKFEVQMISERALHLRNRLKKEKRFLIILDDIWNKLKLEDVGIVFESDQKGCEILMTSRFESVLGNDMGVDKNFKVDILSEDEARNWFESIVGDKIVTTPAFQEYGNKIVQKCGCLPLCIVTAAHSLKNCDKLPLWRNAWRQLQRSKHDEVVHTAIKLCYDKLRSDEAKQLLLLCSLHEEDANIKMEDLMKYCVGQINMFKDAYTLQEARDLVYCLVEELKDCCLLLDGDHSGTVKMHDVVRDVAISIAKESHGMHCFGDGSEVEKFLEEKKFEDLKAISLPNCYLDELVFGRSEYTQLQLMICMSKKSSLKIIPRDFLERTKVLRVLVFSENIPLFLPKVFASHLSPLQNLCTLCLRYSDVEDIAEIGKLKNLEILDLFGSKIKKLPGEIGQLTRLRMLDLNRCENLQVIEPNVLLHLKRLEELYVDEFKNWHRIDQVDNNGERRNAGLDELKHLDRLTALHLYVSDIKMLPEDLLSQQLERCTIEINIEKWIRQKEIRAMTRYLPIEHVSRHLPIEHVSRQLQIGQTESSLLREHGLEILMKKSEELWLEGLNGVNNIVSELDTEGFPELRSLELRTNNTIQHLVNSMGQIVFRRLEALFLEDLSNLQQLCHGEVTVESFKMLRAVTVRKCNSLKKLLPLFNARQIEEIRIRDCNAMEEIFTHEIQDDVHDDDDNNTEELLQLRTLVLVDLSKLREFCSEILLKKIGSSQKQKEPFVGDSIMPPLFNGKFLCLPKLENLELCGCHVKKIWDDQFLPSLTSFSCLKKLVVANCKFLKCVFSSSTAAGFKQLSHLWVTSCEAMEIIVGRDERMDKMSFPKLSCLRLKGLPRLSKFSSGIFSEFPMLYQLYISNCPELKTFISVSSEEKSNTTMPSLFNENFLCLPKLEDVVLQGCNFKKIWDDDQLLPSSTSFCCLSKLMVDDCPLLKYAFSSPMAVRFEQLESVVVRDCGTMEEIMSRSDESMDNISFPKLKLLTISNNPNMVSFSKTSEGSSLFDERFLCFPKLENLGLRGCHVKKIWDDQFLPSLTSFSCLKKLVVANCKILKCVVSSSTASSFEHLSYLEVRCCEAMEIIVSRDERTNKMPFPKLGSLRLEGLPRLSKFSSGIFCEFPMLSDLYVGNCPELKTFISESSEDKSNKTMPSLFNENFLCFPKLSHVELWRCNFKKIWDDDHQLLPSSTSFCCLSKLVVDHCPLLKYAFSSAMAVRFEQLESVQVHYCGTMKEIMSRSDESMDNISFPKLKSLTISNNPNMVSFSKISESSSLFDERSLCFPKLDNLELRGCRVKKIWDDQFLPSSTSFCCLKKLVVAHCKFLKCVVSSSTASSFKHLWHLEVKGCKAMEIIVSRDERTNKMSLPKLGRLRLQGLPRLSKFSSGIFCEFPMLSDLYVGDCPELKTFISDSSEVKSNNTMPSLFNENFLCFPKLSHVELQRCNFKKIWDDDQLLPSSTSFCCLSKLVVDDCPLLKYAFSSAMAVRFEQLESVQVHYCGTMKEIMSRSDESMDNISFPKLKSLTISNNPNMVSFSKTSESSSLFDERFLCFPKLEYVELQGCNLKKIWDDDQLLPSSTSFCCLSKLVVDDCPLLKYAFSSAMAVRFEQLESVQVHYCGTMKEIMSRSDESMDNISFPKLKSLTISNNPNMVSFSKTSESSSLFDERFLCFPKLEYVELQGCNLKKIWDDDQLLPSSTSFCCLSKLVVDDCPLLKYAFSSAMAVRFEQLESVQVHYCGTMKEIMSRSGESMDNISFPKLKSLTISNNPNMVSFSKTSESSSLFDERVAFPSLSSVCVDGMDGLKMIWQYGGLCNNTDSFCKLEEVEVEKCKNLKAIFSSGMRTRVGNLKRLKISECEMVEEIFEMETSNCGIEEVAGKQEGLEKVVSPDDEFVFPQLQEMVLESLPNLVSFYAGTHTLRFPSLKNLEVIKCLKVKALSGSDLLSYQGRHESLFSTKVTFGKDCNCKIKLYKLPNMMHLMEEEEESSQQQPQTLFIPDVIDLKVWECEKLKNLVPSSISFQNLNSLILTDCHGMLHLLSSQTAKSMTQLSSLTIRSCKRMEEIISDAGVDHWKGGEIVFTRLYHLVLDDLPTLASFYSGSCTMRFPNLKGLRVCWCYKMQNFSNHGIISTPQLKEIYIDFTAYKVSDLESKLKSESETESSSNWMVGINSIIAKHCTSHHRLTALQELFTEKDITPSNPSEE